MVKVTPSWQAVSGLEGPKERSRWVVASKLPGVWRPLLECLEAAPVELLQKTGFYLGHAAAQPPCERCHVEPVPHTPGLSLGWVRSGTSPGTAGRL